MEDNSWFDTHFLEDGSVQICYKHYCGWCTSAHLIVPKALQLRTAYNKDHGIQDTLSTS
jgi:hypothetical protein